MLPNIQHLTLNIISNNNPPDPMQPQILMQSPTCVEAGEAIGMYRKTIAKWCKGITTSKSGYKARYETSSN